MITDNLLCGYLRTLTFSASMMDGFLQAVLKSITNSNDCISVDTVEKTASSSVHKGLHQNHQLYLPQFIGPEKNCVL